MPGSPLILPRNFFVFVHQSDEQLWRECEIDGVIRSTSVTLAREGRSADELPVVRNVGEPASLGTGMAQILAPAAVEFDAETWRRTVAPQSPSRATAIFAYGSFATARQAQRLYGWDPGEVRAFTLSREADVRVARVSLAILALAREAYGRHALNPATAEELWRSYWTGAADHAVEASARAAEGHRGASSGHMWEYLVHGQLVRAPRARDPRPAEFSGISAAH